MTEPSAAIQWLLLSNLSRGWAYSVNIRQEAADVALQWAIQSGYTDDGCSLTDAGKAALICNVHNALTGDNGEGIE